MGLFSAGKVGLLALFALQPLLLAPSIATPPTHPPADDSVQVEGGGVDYFDGLRSCDVLQRSDGIASLTPGSGRIHGPILCTEPTDVEVAQGKVILYSHNPVEMTNVHFIVHPGATLALYAPALEFKRTHVTEDHHRPLFEVHGFLRLDATSPLPTRVEEGGSMSDEHGMIFRGQEGRVRSTWSIVYSHDRINVGMVPPEVILRQQILGDNIPIIPRPDLNGDNSNSPTDHRADEAPPRTSTASSDGDMPPVSPPAPEAGAFHSSPAAAPAAASTADGAHGRGMIFVRSQQAGKTDQHRMFDSETIRSCSDIPAVDAYFVGGIITILGDIICREPTIVELAGSTIIRSDKDILTQNVFWIVHDAMVVFDAPTVTLSRSKKYDDREDVPTLMVGPKASVRFNVHGWVPAFAKGTPRDEKGLAEAAFGGSIAPVFGTLHYSGDAIMAADPMADQGPDESTGNGWMNSVRHSRDVDLAEHLGSMFTALQDRESKTAPGSARTRDGDGSSSDRGSAARDDDDGGSGGSGSSSGSRNRAGGNGGSSADWEPSPHPAAMLKGGERLPVPKVLLSADRTSGLFADPTDASLRFFRKVVSAPPPEGQGNRAANEPSIHTMIRSCRQKMDHVHKTRQDIAREDVERSMSKKRGFWGRVKSAVLFAGKDGVLTRAKRQRAREHLGEVDIAFTKRGFVEGYLDGTRVLKEGGPSWFSCFRREREDYELRATDDGMEVTRGGRYVWGIPYQRDG
eukprot:g15481.t1